MMASLHFLARWAILAAREQRAVNSVEYLLAVSTVVIVFVAVLIGSADALFPAIAGFMCPAIDTGDPGVGYGTCLAP